MKKVENLMIDKSYYNAMVDGAVETISKYGDFEMFVSQSYAKCSSPIMRED